MDETFNNLRKFRMKLNCEKYALIVSAGKFLRFKINERQIEANPKKVKTVVEISGLRTIENV